MIGIIYKFTILDGELKYFGNNPFYLGQHLEKLSVDHFLSNKTKGYYEGSGKLWQKFVKALKRKHPTNWQMFIKREILFCSDKVTQRGLDAMEAYYIKKHNAHYSCKQGGCNVLYGTANKFGSGSPMKDAKIAFRVTNKLRGRKGAKRSEEGRKNMSIAAKKSWVNADKGERKYQNYKE